MNATLARLVPDGLAARFALLLASALVAANLIALFVLSSERERLGREAQDDQEIGRIVALVPALEAVDPSLWRAVARDASTRTAHLDVGAEPMVPSTTPDARARALALRLSALLGPREVRVALLDRDSIRDPGRGPDRIPGRDSNRIPGIDPSRIPSRDPSRIPNRDRGGPRPDDRQPPPRRDEQGLIAASIALSGWSGGTDPIAWLNTTTRRDDGGRRAGAIEEEVFMLILALSLVTVLGVGLLFVRHLTRPLSRLADAARAAGQGDRTARVEESGAREMRAAALAFHAMQERIARFDAERARTVAAVGHDLRTPITSLRIRAEMLDGATREPMVRTLEEMTVMADGLIAFSRDQGEVESRQPVRLDELLARLCEERGARLERTIETIVPGRPVALIRALGNLVDNAIRYGGEARVALSHRGELATIVIEDAGPGIPEDQLDDVFEPFVRGEGSRSVETGGAGLGLSIARTILQAHGGTITLDNRERGGLRASVSLPLAGRPSRAAPESPPPAERDP